MSTKAAREQARQKCGRLAAAFLIAFVGLDTASARESTLPLEIQTRLFRKILGYDVALSEAREVRLLIVTSNEPGDAAALVDAFRNVGLRAEAVTESGLEERADPTRVVYVPAGGPSEKVRRLCARHGMLSISGVAAHGEQGEVAIALGTRADGRPEIIVNEGRLHVEKHELRAELLRLARVVP